MTEPMYITQQLATLREEIALMKQENKHLKEVEALRFQLQTVREENIRLQEQNKNLTESLNTTKNLAKQELQKKNEDLKITNKK